MTLAFSIRHIRVKRIMSVFARINRPCFSYAVYANCRLQRPRVWPIRLSPTLYVIQRSPHRQPTGTWAPCGVSYLDVLAGDLCVGSEVVMAALRSRCEHYIFVLFLSFSFFSSPNLSRRRLDVYHTSTHGVALVRV